MNQDVETATCPACDGTGACPRHGRCPICTGSGTVPPRIADTISRGHVSIMEGFEWVDAAMKLRWATERTKVVEDQRAADLELIETQRLALVERDATVRRLRHDLARAGTDLDRLTKGAVMPDPSRDGAQRLHNWFGLSYANYLTLPRSILQSMPGEWQGKMTDLLAELGEAFAAFPDHGAEYHVQLRDEDGDDVEDPLAEYRRPDRDYIEFLRKKPS